jgi:hypothetical protein
MFIVAGWVFHMNGLAAAILSSTDSLRQNCWTRTRVRTAVPPHLKRPWIDGSFHGSRVAGSHWRAKTLAGPPATRLRRTRVQVRLAQRAAQQDAPQSQHALRRSPSLPDVPWPRRNPSPINGLKRARQARVTGRTRKEDVREYRSVTACRPVRADIPRLGMRQMRGGRCERSGRPPGRRRGSCGRLCGLLGGLRSGGDLD